MSETSNHQGFVVRQAPQTGTFDFPTFMDGLRRPLTEAQIVAAGESLLGANELFEAIARDSQPLPDRGVRLVDSLRREFARMEALHARLLECAVAPSAPPAVPALLPALGAGDPVSPPEKLSPIQFDPMVEILMTLNYWHIEKTADPGAAAAALTALMKRLSRKKPMGRPRSRPVSQVRDAKRLRDRGLTHGQIANMLPSFRDAKAVALALRYEFRDQLPKKKSR